MGLPQANIVLFFLSAFVGLWGLSVIARGLTHRGVARRACPECDEDLTGVAGRRCTACGYEAQNESELRRPRVRWRVVPVGAVALALGLALAWAGRYVRSWELGEMLSTQLHPVHALFGGVIAFGVVLLGWAIYGERSKGRRRCPKCWYDMSATLDERAQQSLDVSLLCPECGHEPANERGLYRARRRRAAALWALVLVVLGLYGQNVPRAIRGGPIGLVPTTVLVLGVPWLPISWYEQPNAPDAATLRHRIAERRVWGWQRDVAERVARGALRGEAGWDRFMLAHALSDFSNPETRGWALVGLTRMLGDSSVQIPNAGLGRISQNLLYAEDGIPSRPKAKLTEVIAERRVGLEQRVSSSTEEITNLLIGSIVMQSDARGEAAIAIAETLVRNPRLSRWYSRPFDPMPLLLFHLCKEDVRARDRVRALAKHQDVRVRRSIAYNAVDALRDGWGDELDVILAEMIIADEDAEIVDIVLRRVWDRSGPGKQRLLDAADDLPVPVRIHIASSFLSRDLSAFEMIAPLVEAPDPGAVHSALAYFEATIDDSECDLDEIRRVCLPLLEDTDYASWRARRLLEKIDQMQARVPLHP